jgi:hypothetical protein
MSSSLIGTLMITGTLLVLYYIIIILMLDGKLFKNKLDFHLSLIPFYTVIILPLYIVCRLILRWLHNLINNYKEL